MTKQITREKFMERIEGKEILEETDKYVTWKDTEVVRRAYFKDGEFTCHKTIIRF